MSGPGPQPNAADWLQQAERDLQAAKLLLSNDFFEWCAYASCQSSEKSCKAIVIALGTNIGEPGGLKTHTVRRLLGGLPPIPQHVDMAAALATLPLHDQQSRYPDEGGPGAPCSRYTRQTAEECVRLAEVAHDFAKQLVPKIATFWAGVASPPSPAAPAGPQTT